MCVVCGCAPGVEHAHPHPDPHSLPHPRPHPPGQAGGGDAAAAPPRHPADLDFGANAARVSVPGLSSERAIRIEEDVLGANDRVARANRAHFGAHGVAAFNLVSSPGSGKTTLLVATIEALRRRAPALPLAVIEGDQQTSHDADRIRATGAPAVQVNTGKGCHLDAPMVAAAFERLPLHGHGDDHDPAARPGSSILFIENVGNLVCPAMWDLGERAKVAILSVTEGEDKPLKYPDMFAASRLMVLTKTDLLPHLEFDVARCIEYARRVNPAIEVLLLSSRSGQGMESWLDWLLEELAPGPGPSAGPRPGRPAIPAGDRPAFALGEERS